jgi:hypothetical protein
MQYFFDFTQGCPDGSTCADIEGLCQTMQLTTSTSTSTSTSFSTATITSATTSQTCVPSRAPGGTSPFCNRSGPSSNDPGDFVLINGKCLPIWDFIYVEELTDELIESMCGGKFNNYTRVGRISLTNL